MCEGPVEGIISQLMSSLSSTLQSQLTNTVANYVAPPSSAHSDQTQMKQFSSLSNLPRIWKSSLATQVIIHATQIALETGLNQAIQAQNSESTKLVESFVKEINSLTSLAVSLIKGKSLQDDDVTKPCPSDMLQLSTSRDQGDSTLIIAGEGPTSTTALDEGQRSSRAYITPKHQTRKMENILMVLSSYRYKTEELKSILSTIRNISSSFEWQSLLHYEWSTQDNQAVITTIGARLNYGYHYTGSTGRLVLTPRMEKAVCYLLETVKQGNSSLIIGKEVHSTLHVHVFTSLVSCLIFACECTG